MISCILLSQFAVAPCVRAAKIIIKKHKILKNTNTFCPLDEICYFWS